MSILSLIHNLVAFFAFLCTDSGMVDVSSSRDISMTSSCSSEATPSKCENGGFVDRMLFSHEPKVEPHYERSLFSSCFGGYDSMYGGFKHGEGHPDAVVGFGVGLGTLREEEGDGYGGVEEEEEDMDGVGGLSSFELDAEALTWINVSED